jgi:hypothetical protein
MPDTQPAWQEFEQLIASIQQQLAPQAEVRHNQRIRGLSKRLRQLDVTISQIIGLCPIFIVLECKRYTRPVGIEKVEAFAQKLIDVRASLGVMISPTGFDAGARAIASRNNIMLLTYRQAEEADWEVLIGSNSWTILTRVEISSVNTTAIISEQPNPITIPFDAQFYSQDGEILGNVKDVFWNVWRQIPVPRPIGEFKVELTDDGQPLFFSDGTRLIQVQKVKVEAELKALKYMVSLRLAEGNILEDSQSETPMYRELNSQGFDWGNIMKSQQGIEVDQQEYEQIQNSSIGTVDLTNAKQWLRVVYTDRK